MQSRLVLPSEVVSQRLAANPLGRVAVCLDLAECHQSTAQPILSPQQNQSHRQLTVLHCPGCNRHGRIALCRQVTRQINPPSTQSGNDERDATPETSELRAARAMSHMVDCPPTSVAHSSRHHADCRAFAASLPATDDPFDLPPARAQEPVDSTELFRSSWFARARLIRGVFPPLAESVQNARLTQHAQSPERAYARRDAQTLSFPSAHLRIRHDTRDSPLRSEPYDPSIV